jgi:hypothetical protein
MYGYFPGSHETAPEVIVVLLSHRKLIPHARISAMTAERLKNVEQTDICLPPHINAVRFKYQMVTFREKGIFVHSIRVSTWIL